MPASLMVAWLYASTVLSTCESRSRICPRTAWASALFALTAGGSAAADDAVAASAAASAPTANQACSGLNLECNLSKHTISPPFFDCGDGCARPGGRLTDQSRSGGETRGVGR